MKIVVSQQDKKLIAEFHNGKNINRYLLEKADDFLVCIDKFLTKYHTTGSDSFKNVKLEFHNTGILTERVIRSIMLGFCF